MLLVPSLGDDLIEGGVWLLAEEAAQMSMFGSFKGARMDSSLVGMCIVDDFCLPVGGDVICCDELITLLGGLELLMCFILESELFNEDRVC